MHTILSYFMIELCLIENTQQVALYATQFLALHIKVLIHCQTDQPRPCSVDLAVNIKLHVIVPHPYPYPGHAEQGHDEVGNFVVVIVVHLLSVDPFYLETFPH